MNAGNDMQLSGRSSVFHLMERHKMKMLIV